MKLNSICEHVVNSKKWEWLRIYWTKMHCRLGCWSTAFVKTENKYHGSAMFGLIASKNWSGSENSSVKGWSNIRIQSDICKLKCLSNSCLFQIKIWFPLSHSLCGTQIKRHSSPFCPYSSCHPAPLILSSQTCTVCLELCLSAAHSEFVLTEEGTSDAESFGCCCCFFIVYSGIYQHTSGIHGARHVTFYSLSCRVLGIFILTSTFSAWLY